MTDLIPAGELDGYGRLVARRNARSMPLKGAPRSPQARSFVTHLMDTIIIPFKAAKGQARPSSLAKCQKALEALLPDILATTKLQRWGKCGTSNEARVGYPGGSTAFNVVRFALEGAGLLEELKGCYRLATEAQKWTFGEEDEYHLTAFQPTQALLDLAATLGVTLDALSRHFSSSAENASIPEVPIVARGHKPIGCKRPAKVLALEPPAPHVARMYDLNCHLVNGRRVEGIAFSGLRRIFNNATIEGYQWQTGGRFYAVQGWEAGETLPRDQRLGLIRIDGEEVAEVDISAAHLTILYGLSGLPFDPTNDPYVIDGFSREAIKKWITRVLGRGSSTIDLSWRGIDRLSAVRAAAEDVHPILRALEGVGLGALTFQYHESEIVFLAMEALRDTHGIGFLPVHDALIVPKSKRDIAVAAIEGAFYQYFVDVLGQKSSPRPRLH